MTTASIAAEIANAAHINAHFVATLDLSKAYDRLQPWIVLMVFAKLGMPAMLLIHLADIWLNQNGHAARRHVVARRPHRLPGVRHLRSRPQVAHVSRENLR